ncbi:hypothetical protein Tco_0515500 [Tanacetum coccineum]
MDWSPQCNDFLVRVSCDDDVGDVNIVEPMLVMVIFKETTESVIKKEDMAKRKMMNSCVYIWQIYLIMCGDMFKDSNFYLKSRGSIEDFVSFREMITSQLQGKLWLYDEVQTNVISIADSEETLMLEEESRSKMLLKQSDPLVLEKKVNIKPVNYAVLNKLSEDFGKRFVPQQELSTEQAFWFQMSNPSTNSSDASPVKVYVPSKLPKIWDVKRRNLILSYAGRGEHSQEINNLSAPALISQAPGPSRKRSRSPSSPFFLDFITSSDGKPASETSELNLEDVTARLEYLEVEIDTLHADTEDKELLISELQDSLAAAENEIAILQIKGSDTRADV